MRKWSESRHLLEVRKVCESKTANLNQIELMLNVYDLNLGQIWTRTPTDFDWWEVELVFRVTGRGRIGADGLVH